MTARASVGDIGLPISIPLAQTPDLTGATVTIEVVRPYPSTSASWSATATTTNGVTTISYTTASGDLPVPGPYLLRVRAAFGDGRVLRDPLARKLEVRE